MNPAQPMPPHKPAPPARELRVRSLTERPGIWIGLALLVFVPLAGFALASSQGGLASLDPVLFAGALRGYTLPGLVLGIMAVVLIAFTFAYSIRKRGRSSGKHATMMTWLWVHVYAGLLAFVLATVHAGPGVISFTFSSGKVLWFAFAAVVVSGVAWRLVYAWVPPVAGPQVVNYSKEGSSRRATEQETEIEKLAAGKSPALHDAKAQLLAAPRAPQEIAMLASRVPAEEQALLGEMARLAAARHRALARVRLQEKFTRRLQGWRVLHVPVTLLLVLLLVVHVIGALEVPEKILPAGTAQDGPFAPFIESATCKGCHASIYAQWADSMHAHALSSPLTVAQNNIDVRISLKDAPSPDPKRVCIQCHAPVGGLATREETLPLPGGRINNDGISCTSCHAHEGPAQPGTGGFRAGGLLGKLEPGRTYYGPIANPVGNAFHKSKPSPMFSSPETICGSCHNVNLDRDHDGKIVKGVDLVLQTTFDEWNEYKKAGGTASCVSCHMPVAAGLTRAADGALVPFEQDRDAPPREVHDHSFVGVDYPLDTVAKSDPQEPKRAALLRTAAGLAFETAPVVEGGKLKLQVSLTNTTGHNLPTGFAFARQMWLEVQVSNGAELLFASGKLAKPANDLCDAATLEDDLKRFVVGCDAADKDLVNIQLKLMDSIAVLPDAKGQPAKDDRGEFIVVGGKDAKETVLQHPAGGPIARKRPSTKEALVPLRPLEKRVFTYAIPVGRGVARGAGSVQVRLLFRNIPPYFIRAMTALQAEGEPKVGTLVDNLKTVEMGSLKGSF
ncbi:MAG: multiheme c-type cytochrome [Polyangiaceae bacterium]